MIIMEAEHIYTAVTFTAFPICIKPAPYRKPRCVASEHFLTMKSGHVVAAVCVNDCHVASLSFCILLFSNEMIVINPLHEFLKSFTKVSTFAYIAEYLANRPSIHL